MIDWTPGLTLDEVEKITIRQAYKFYRDNKTTTASALGIAIKTLASKLEKYESDDANQRRIIEGQRENNRNELARARGTQNQIQASIPGPSTGASVESTSKDTAESKLPLSERKEVQEVLQDAPAKRGNRRASTGI